AFRFFGTRGRDCRHGRGERGVASLKLWAEVRSVGKATPTKGKSAKSMPTEWAGSGDSLSVKDATTSGPLWRNRRWKTGSSCSTACSAELRDACSVRKRNPGCER